MTPEQIEEIIELLAEKLGPMAETVWTIYMKQVYINVVIGTAAFLLFGLASLAFVYSAWRNNRSDDPVDGPFFAVMSAVAAVICFIIAGSALVFETLKILNPEYHAIQMLLGR